MSKMVEDVAKALHELGTGMGYEWERADESEKEYARRYARTAVQAVHDYLKSGDFGYEECQECAVSRVVEGELGQMRA